MQMGHFTFKTGLHPFAAYGLQPFFIEIILWFKYSQSYMPSCGQFINLCLENEIKALILIRE